MIFIYAKLCTADYPIRYVFISTLNNLFCCIAPTLRVILKCLKQIYEELEILPAVSGVR